MSDELTSALRALATEAERPPELSGAEIRGRATGRRRRRRTAVAAAGVCVAGVLALLLVVDPGGGTRHRTPPAASPTVSASPPLSSPDATIDLGTRELSVGGLRLTLNGDSLNGYTSAFRTTVAAKAAHVKFSGKTVGLDDNYSFMATWVLELTAPGGRTDYVGAMPHDGSVYSSPRGWIGLDPDDAKLLYERLEPGATVEIKPSSGNTKVPGTSTGTGTGTGTWGG